MPAVYINDGYTVTEEFKIGKYDPFSITFRPLAYEDEAELNDRAPRDKATTKEYLKVLGEVLAKHIVSWTIVDGSGSPVKVEPAAFQRIPPIIVHEIFLRMQVPSNVRETEEKN